jgi:hypothetical protein
MQSSRDSSVWKSLAVAFGDGVAFAVGMKLSQNAVSRPETEARARIEQAPAAPPPVAPPPFDRKVLEAVVSAVDERLKEHAGQVERRIAESESRVEARVAEMRAELAAKSGEIVKLRRDLLLAIGQTCLDAAERVNPPAPTL